MTRQWSQQDQWQSKVDRRQTCPCDERQAAISGQFQRYDPPGEDVQGRNCYYRKSNSNFGLQVGSGILNETRLHGPVPARTRAFLYKWDPNINQIKEIFEYIQPQSLTSVTLLKIINFLQTMTHSRILKGADSCMLRGSTAMINLTILFCWLEDLLFMSWVWVKISIHGSIVNVTLY